MEETLLASLTPLTTAIDQAVTIVDSAGTVLAWNPAAERLYGIANSTILGNNIAAFFPPATLMVQRVLNTGQPVESKYHQPRPGIHVLVTAMPIYARAAVVGVLAVERDVTHMVKLSTDLLAARDRVAELEKRLMPTPPAGEAGTDPFGLLRGRHPLLLAAIAMARLVAPTEAVTLIRGESGVGKELFARGVHLASKRSGGPFIALNCGAITTTLFESELFGYARGAFTGALPAGQPGKLAMADGGTLFLDEIGDLPMEGQVKLLRFLEDRQFYRVGGTTSVTVDVRIIAATNRPLEKLVAQGRFREDLYWRLNVICLEPPPLRERKEDIADLIQFHIHEFNIKHGRAVSQVDPSVIRVLMEYSWPGNVRELRNTVERLVVLAPDGVIGLDLLPTSLRPAVIQRAGCDEAVSTGAMAGSKPDATADLHEAVAQTTRAQIRQALEATGGNRAGAARALGISRAALYYKCRNLGVPL
ncbi:MAG: sigma-54-dependent transcriptional regulator [Firmicutes bacterium]|nr:sigma-54-dependent transcriptional regulator [Bacillota bacterium]